MHISYLAVSENRCTVQMAGCNFRCLGCFSKERNPCGIELDGHEAAQYIPDGKEVMLAGGEPTLDEEGLVSLVDELALRKVILSTNGYLLDKALLFRLEGISVHIGLKALDPDLHRWYTGRDNGHVLEAIRLLHDLEFDLQVSTVYIPHVVETGEIRRIARFLSTIGEIDYKIIRYVPVGDFSCRPHAWEIEEAVRIAGMYLDTVSSSIESRSHPADRTVIRLSKDY